MKYKLMGDNCIFSPIECILENRGITKELFELTDDCIETYNNYDNIENGIELLVKHMESKNNIHIVVDSDVDGATSFAILYNYLRSEFKDINITYSIHEGKQHGLSKDINIKDNINLVILPDSSSNDYIQHKELKDRGIDVLILDHHLASKYSENAIVINNQLSKNVKNKQLSGAGVVYKFLKALDGYLFINKADDYLDLVALGNIADMMDLREEETRYLCYKGMEQINNTFIKALIENNSFELDNKFSVMQLSWTVAPKLNGVIRSGTLAEKANMFKAFISDDYDFCLEVAKKCKNAKSRQDNAVKKYMKSIENINVTNKKCILLEVDEKLNRNHTGLVANKLMSKYGVPILLYRETKEGLVEGSGRGNDNITKDFNADLINSGYMQYVEGHEQAFGFGIKKENINKLEEYLNRLYINKIPSLEEEYDVDFDVNFEELDNDFITEIASYEKQWGGGINEPLIHISKIYIGDVTKDNMIGNSLLNFYVDDIEFCKKYPTKLFRESIFNRTFEAEIIGKFTMDTYKNCGRIEIVDMKIK